MKTAILTEEILVDASNLNYQCVLLEENRTKYGDNEYNDGVEGQHTIEYCSSKSSERYVMMMELID